MFYRTPAIFTEIRAINKKLALTKYRHLGETGVFNGRLTNSVMEVVDDLNDFIQSLPPTGN